MTQYTYTACSLVSTPTLMRSHITKRHNNNTKYKNKTNTQNNQREKKDIQTKHRHLYHCAKLGRRGGTNNRSGFVPGVAGKKRPTGSFDGVEMRAVDHDHIVSLWVKDRT